MFDSMNIWSQYLFMLITAIGFNVETVQYNNIKFQVWDLGVLSVRELLLHFLALLFWVLSDFGLLHRLFSAMSLGSNQVMCGHGRGSNEHQVLNFLVLFYFHGCNLAVGLTILLRYHTLIKCSCGNCCRPYWRCYYPNTQAIIYVVDSSDTERMSIAQEEFHAILQVPMEISF